MKEVIYFWIDILSRCVQWLFSIQIIEEPNISFGMFILACAFIGIVLYFILGSDFFPGHIGISSRVNNNYSNYAPRHGPGSSNVDFSSRVNRHKY